MIYFIKCSIYCKRIRQYIRKKINYDFGRNNYNNYHETFHHFYVWDGYKPNENFCMNENSTYSVLIKNNI